MAEHGTDYGIGNWYYSLFDVTPHVDALSTSIIGGLGSRFNSDVVDVIAKERKLVSSVDLAIAASVDRDTFAAVAIGRADQQPMFDSYFVGATSGADLQTLCNAKRNTAASRQPSREMATVLGT